MHDIKEAQELGDKINKIAGRNLGLALLTAVVSAGTLALLLIFLPDFFVIVLVLLSAVAIWELRNLLDKAGIKIPVIFLILASAIIIYSAYLGTIDSMLLAFIGCVLISIIYNTLDFGTSNKLFNSLASIFTLIYIPFMIGFLVLVLNQPFASYRVIIILTTSLACDTGAWLVGRIWGKHKIFPKISPNKSWEGLGGGVAVAFIWVYVITTLFFPNNYVPGSAWFPLIAVPLGCIMAVIGDFAESLLKRVLDVKDSGDFFPGHGGVLDRVDSILFNLPAMFFLLSFIS